MINKAQRIQELIKKLNYYTKLYDEGRPEISDKEWDDMYFELCDLEKETGLMYGNSPNNYIEYKVASELTKVEHNHPLLSLAKTKSLDDVKKFVKGHGYYSVMAKMDGLTISVRYLNGKLISAETRGDGNIGEDITRNAYFIKNLPQTISYKEELIIDGEAIITYQDFEPFKDKYANPRNLVSGSIRLLDSLEFAKRNVSFVAWKVYKGFEEDKYYSLKLIRLNDLGFNIVPAETLPMELEQAVENIKKYSRKSGYPIDGCVIGIDSINEAMSMGEATAHHVQYQLAYKFYDEEYESTLRDIEWTMGRTGQLTPVAVFDDIDFGDSTVNRASLHNISIMKQLWPHIWHNGLVVTVYKANMIIPHISKVKENSQSFEPANSEAEEVANRIIIGRQKLSHCFIDLSIPSVCPICGKPTEIREDGIAQILYCTNPQCEGKLVNIIDHFAGKKGLDIKGLSIATINKLIIWGWVNNIKDIFTLRKHRDEWVKKVGFGAASVDKILDAIDKATIFNLQRYICALGIPEVGTAVSKELVKHYPTWEQFRKVSYKDLIKINGIGDIMADKITKFDYTDADFIVDNYMIQDSTVDTFNAIGTVNSLSTTELEQILSLKNKTFVITGKLSYYKNRDELISVIEAHGGKVTGSISKNTNYLINNDINSTSSKNIMAKKLDIPIITEEELNKMIGD